MKKTSTTVIAAVLALASGMAMAAQGSVANPYAVQPDEVRVFNNAPSDKEITKICGHMAKYEKLSGAEQDKFLATCKQDV